MRLIVFAIVTSCIGLTLIVLNRRLGRKAQGFHYKATGRLMSELHYRVAYVLVGAVFILFAIAAILGLVQIGD